MFVETIGAISTGVSTIELSERLFPTFKRVFSLLRNGNIKIAILGAGGTGKTTLGKLLSGEFAIDSLVEGYQESIAEEQYKLSSDLPGSLIVVPGQERREDTWGDLLRAITDGKIKLVVHVVSWGYHSFGEFSYTQHRLYKGGMAVDRFIASYTEDRRVRELDVLGNLKPYLKISNQNQVFLITLVTKQDLWWNKRFEVRDYYQSGEYEKLIQAIRDEIGSSNFVHEYCSASLVMENFLSGANELLIPTTQGYDERIKLTNFTSFISVLENLLNISLNIGGQ